MKKKLQGRKGRPSEGKQRSFSCSDEKYEVITLAADSKGVSVSEFVRDAAYELAKSVLKTE